MNDDFRDLLAALLRVSARFLVVGAHAMAVHGVPRANGVLDVWIDSEPANLDRVWEALLDFGAPLRDGGVSREDLDVAATVVQIGLPPRRIDILNEVSGLVFDEAWNNRSLHSVGPREVPFLSREDLIRNKKATARPKDAVDLAILEGREDEA